MLEAGIIPANVNPNSTDVMKGMKRPSVCMKEIGYLFRNCSAMPPAGRFLKKAPQKRSGCIPFCRSAPLGLSGKRGCLLVHSNTVGKPIPYE